MSDPRHLLLIALLAIVVRLFYLYEVQGEPLLAHPSGVASIYNGQTAEQGSGLDHPLPAPPIYRQLSSSALDIADGDPFPLYVCQALAGAATCILLYLLGTFLFGRAIGLAGGVAASLYGPSILLVAESTPATWSALLQVLFLLTVVRPPVQKPSFRWAISGVLLTLVVVESFPIRNLPESLDLTGHAINLFHLVQGRELLPDLDPYLLNARSRVLAALLWDGWLALPFGLILPLAAPGLLLYGRRSTWRTAEGRTVLLFFLASALIGTLSPDARQRLPMALLLLPFATFAVVRLTQSPHRRAQVASFLLLLFICNVKIEAPRQLAGADHHAYWMGVAYARQGMVNSAIGAYRRAIERTPTHTPATRELARSYLNAGQPDEALAVCQTFLQSGSETAAVLLLQGDAYALSGRMDDAASAYERIRATGQNTVEVLVRLGETYRALARLDPAADMYAEAVEVRPDSSELRHRLAGLYDIGGRTGMAIAQYRLLLADDRENHVLHAKLGAALLKMVLGDQLFELAFNLPDGANVREAQTHLDEAIRLRPNYLGARQLLALLLSRQQRYAEAIAQLEIVVQALPDDPYPHLLMGRLNERAGNAEKARHHMDSYRRLDRGVRLENAARAELDRVIGEMKPDLSGPR